MSPRGFLCIFAAEISLAACAEPVETQREIPAQVEGKEVKIELGAKDGRIEARGDEITIVDAGAVIRLSGNAEVELDKPVALRARASNIKLNTKTSRLELSGDVRAHFRIGVRGAEDAGI